MKAESTIKKTIKALTEKEDWLVDAIKDGRENGREDLLDFVGQLDVIRARLDALRWVIGQQNY